MWKLILVLWLWCVGWVIGLGLVVDWLGEDVVGILVFGELSGLLFFLDIVFFFGCKFFIDVQVFIKVLLIEKCLFESSGVIL